MYHLKQMLVFDLLKSGQLTPREKIEFIIKLLGVGGGVEIVCNQTLFEEARVFPGSSPELGDIELLIVGI